MTSVEAIEPKNNAAPVLQVAIEVPKNPTIVLSIVLILTGKAPRIAKWPPMIATPMPAVIPATQNNPFVNLLAMHRLTRGARQGKQGQSIMMNDPKITLNIQ